ncbi:MAG TPA: hypothetical protein VGL53_04105 [Bryobacteraceae bacterium]|jgi:hypothetical protein
MPPSNRITALTFDDLAQRLVRDLANLIRAGGMTERSLAVHLGLSQPHLHNVLHGARKLTPVVADQVMERLGWSALDLVETVEALALVGRRQSMLEAGREIPLNPSARMSGVQFETLESVPPRMRMLDENGGVTVPNHWLDRAGEPFAVTAGEDPEMEGIVAKGDILLVDRSADARNHWHEDALYVVEAGSGSYARWVRFSSRGLYLVSAVTWAEPTTWTLVITKASRRAEVIEGKVIALARPLERRFRRPARPFASS